MLITPDALVTESGKFQYMLHVRRHGKATIHPTFEHRFRTYNRTRALTGVPTKPHSWGHHCIRTTVLE